MMRNTTRPPKLFTTTLSCIASTPGGPSDAATTSRNDNRPHVTVALRVQVQCEHSKTRRVHTKRQLDKCGVGL